MSKAVDYKDWVIRRTCSEDRYFKLRAKALTLKANLEKLKKEGKEMNLIELKKRISELKDLGITTVAEFYEFCKKGKIL